jgi:hypothetical protein
MISLTDLTTGVPIVLNTIITVCEAYISLQPAFYSGDISGNLASHWLRPLLPYILYDQHFPHSVSNLA